MYWKEFLRPSLRKELLVVSLILFGLSFNISGFIGIFKNWTGTGDPPIVQWLIGSSGCSALLGTDNLLQCRWFGFVIGNFSPFIGIALHVFSFISLVGGLCLLTAFAKFENRKGVQKKILIAFLVFIVLLIVCLISIGYLYRIPSRIAPL